MLTGNLVRTRMSKGRIIPLYLKRESPEWLEVAETLLLLFREGKGRTRGEIEEEVDELVGEGLATLAHRGLAKILEDRAEFEVVADVAPEAVREAVFTAAAERRKALRASGKRGGFRRDEVLEEVGGRLGIAAEHVAASLFADLKDENRLLDFKDLSAERLVDRYNVGLAQSVLLRSVRVTVEVRGERPARYRQLFRQIKFHRLLAKVDGSMDDGYTIQIDGPLSLFNATNRYGLQMANFLPALLLCRDFRLVAELLWGPRREPRSFQLDAGDGLVSHYQDVGTYAPAELAAFVERFRQVAPAWEVSEATEIVELGREGVWVPDYRFVHRATGVDVLVEVLGFWKRSSLERLLRLLPAHGPLRYLLAIAERLKVDEEALGDLAGPVLRFKEIPNAPELAGLLDGFLPRKGGLPLP